MRNRYLPREGLYVTMMTKRKAEQHTRYVHNVAPHEQLGWRPYTVMVIDGAISHSAYANAREFNRALRSFGLRLRIEARSRGMRTGTLVLRA